MTNWIWKVIRGRFHQTLFTMRYSKNSPFNFTNYETSEFPQISVLNFDKFVCHLPNLSVVCQTPFASKCLLCNKLRPYVDEIEPRCQFHFFFLRKRFLLLILSLSYPPTNGANDQSKICIVSRGGNFFHFGKKSLARTYMVVWHSSVSLSVC